VVDLSARRKRQEKKVPCRLGHNYFFTLKTNATSAITIYTRSTRVTNPRMPTNTSPELKFFMYLDPDEAKKPDNKRLVRVHVARNSHAKTRNARTHKSPPRTNTPQQADQGQEDPGSLQLQAVDAHGSEPDNYQLPLGPASTSQVSPSPSIPCDTPSSPYPPGMFVVDPALSDPCRPTPLAWLPSEGPARDLVLGLSQEERTLLDYCRSRPQTLLSEPTIPMGGHV
jgi:hypothetical protein